MNRTAYTLFLTAIVLFFSSLGRTDWSEYRIEKIKDHCIIAAVFIWGLLAGATAMVP